MNIPDVEILGLEVIKGSVCGRSQSQISKQALLSHLQDIGPIHWEHDLPLTINAMLPLKIMVCTDYDGIEIRLTDPLGTPVLEWRLEGMELE